MRFLTKTILVYAIAFLSLPLFAEKVFMENNFPEYGKIKIPPNWVSMINLIATPERYEGKEIAVKGYLTMMRKN